MATMRHKTRRARLTAAAGGFLLAVLWFDLMFDVQLLRHRNLSTAAAESLDSISAYYRRVTTTAAPMGRLVALVMLTLIAGLITQAVRGDADIWVSAVSLPAAAIGIGLAGARDIIEQHNGTLSVISTPGAGATFITRLPL